MTTLRVLPLQRRLALALPASVLPLVAYEVLALVADARASDHIRLVADDPLFVLSVTWRFVSVPTLFVLVASWHRVTFAGVLAVMTAVAAMAGYLVATIDDAQAGLAILYVPFVAIPLGTAVALAEAIAYRVARRHPPNPAQPTSAP